VLDAAVSCRIGYRRIRMLVISLIQFLVSSLSSFLFYLAKEHRTTQPCRCPCARCRALQDRPFPSPYDAAWSVTGRTITPCSFNFPVSDRSVLMTRIPNIKSPASGLVEGRQSFWPIFPLFPFVCSRPRATDRRTFEPVSRQVICPSADSYASFYFPSFL